MGGPSSPGVVIKSKEAPRRSQLTSSEFLAAMYELEDGLNDSFSQATFTSADDLEGFASELETAAGEAENIGSGQQDKLDNMPEGLQQGSTGELLQNRADFCQQLSNELQEKADSIREVWEELEADHTDEEKSEAAKQKVEDILGEIDWSYE